MARPKTSPLEPKLTSAERAPHPVFEPEFIFRIRRYKAGHHFHNLWEATLLDPRACRDTMVIKTLDDANALNFCMDNIQGHLEAEGF